MNNRARAAIAALIVFHVGAAPAQQDVAPGDREDEAIDEIVVVVRKSGDPVDVEAHYEELLRSRLVNDLQQLRDLEEDYAWRTSGVTVVDSPSRISWGYDPDAELNMRRDTDLMDVQWVTARPATLFRVEF